MSAEVSSKKGEISTRLKDKCGETLFLVATAQPKCLRLQDFYFVPKEPHPKAFQFPPSSFAISKTRGRSICDGENSLPNGKSLLSIVCDLRL